MLGFFKRKDKSQPRQLGVAESLCDLVGNNPDGFVEAVEQLSPGERLMILVGRNAVEPTAFAAIGVAKEENASFDLPGFAAQLENRSKELAQENEVMSRRMWWMMFGTILIHFDFSRVPSETGGRVWASLLSSISIAPGALANNLIWTEEEKSAFVERHPKSAMRTVAAVYMPKRYRETDPLLALEAEYNIII